MGFVALLTVAVPAVPAASAQTTDERFFSQTSYRIDNDAFWNYFQRRGGVNTFGYPVSRQFKLLGFPVQIFQREIMQQNPDGSVATMNILDAGLMPYTRINFSTFPAPDAAITSGTPSPNDPDYGSKIVDFVRQQAPDCKVMIVTADVRLAKEMSEKQGDWEYLPAPDAIYTKPFSLMELVDSVRAFLRK